MRMAIVSELHCCGMYGYDVICWMMKSLPQCLADVMYYPPPSPTPLGNFCICHVCVLVSLFSCADLEYVHEF